MSRGGTVGKCLKFLNLDAANFQGCAGVQEEWTVIKKSFHKTILQCHPDKGGDAAHFRDVRTSFDVLKELYKEGRGVHSFAAADSQSTSSAFDQAFSGNASNPTPPWEFYYAAAQEAMPIYQVELAKSNRSACAAKGAARKCCEDPKKKVTEAIENRLVQGAAEKEQDQMHVTKEHKGQKGKKSASNTGGPAAKKKEPRLTRATAAERKAFKFAAAASDCALGCAAAGALNAPQPIEQALLEETSFAVSKPAVIGKGEMRIGSIEETSGQYGRWMHVECWRVPEKVWKGLPDPDSCKDAFLFEAALLGMNQVLFSGLSEIPTDKRYDLVQHVMCKDNWASYHKRKAKELTKKDKANDEDEEWVPEDDDAVAQKKMKAGSKMALTMEKLLMGDFVVEYAKTGTSCCRLCELPIDQGELRCGPMVPLDADRPSTCIFLPGSLSPHGTT
mmetsp:Transcript_54799/g.88800  ORF Transcript_54799/g.88800 Transcript_54799/m.88800 type:complete len:446 (-) Transcript_54799:432-1769(-)